KSAILDISSVVGRDTNFSTQENDSTYSTDLQPTNAAYVIYTSGSTGTPKGVVNIHSAIVNRILWMQQAYPLTSNDRVLQKTPIGFDVSVWEFLWPFATGATMVLAEPKLHADARYLTQLIQAEQISTLHFVPPMLEVILEQEELALCKSLRQVICSGDVLTPATVQRFYKQLPHAQLYNLYGPTEAAIDVTAWHCTPNGDEAVTPIGFPIANTTVHILSRDLNEVPVGEIGEVYLGGRGLARGYFGQPSLTAESFLPNPFRARHDDHQCATLYRTGDLARYRRDGAIEFLGRRDHQIKIHGIRMELGEIENVLATHPACHQTIVRATKTAAGETRLVGFVTLSESNRLADAQALKPSIQRHLQERLPPAMVPADIVFMESMPLTHNGKINYQRLPVPAFDLRANFVAPQSEAERSIASVWSDVLKVENIGVLDHFFELGGHSLSATRVSARLQKQLNIELPLQRIFEYPVLKDLANQVDAMRIGTSDDSDPQGDHIEIEID
ncbi:MAG: non-ribosomal peptide synthetase, partial [Planctomycetota bacterium]